MADITIDKACCKGCVICLSICPKKIFVRSKKRNDYGTNMPEAVNRDACLFCGMCERLCPDGAISVRKTEEEKEK
ncbi:MAG: 4Fe-4S binding protein [Eubacteriales bacterium]|nr:4Fe-4S binding protein [Eubacteriales bacterium]